MVHSYIFSLDIQQSISVTRCQVCLAYGRGLPSRLIASVTMRSFACTVVFFDDKLGQVTSGFRLFRFRATKLQTRHRSHRISTAAHQQRHNAAEKDHPPAAKRSLRCEPNPVGSDPSPRSTTTNAKAKPARQPHHHRTSSARPPSASTTTTRPQRAEGKEGAARSGRT